MASLLITAWLVLAAALAAALLAMLVAAVFALSASWMSIEPMLINLSFIEESAEYPLL
jgi:hypothetical protein